MARRGGRRGRRSRSRQNRSRRTSSRRRTTTRRSTPSRRRNTRTTTRASNRRASVSKARRAAPKRSAPKKAAPKARRAPTRRSAPKRGSGISQKRKNIGTKIGTSVKNTAKNVASSVKKTVGKVTRPPSAKAKTVTSTRESVFNKQLKNIQAANKTFPGASPNSPLNDPNFKPGPVAGDPFARPGPGGPEKEADYTSYKPGSFYNQSDTNVNMTNALRSTRNLITSPARALGINNQFTNRLIPKSNEAIQDARDQRSQFNVGTKPRPTLKRRGGGGGVSRIQQQAAAQAIQPEIAPTIGAPPAEEYLPDDAGDLTRIQTQAYNTALTNNMAGIGGNFDFSPQGSQMSISQAPGLQAGQSRGRRQIRRFGRGRRRGSGDSFRRGGRRIQQFTSTQLNI